MDEDLKNPGALIDTRPPEKKKKDYWFGEIVAAADPVSWVEKPENQWRRFPDQDQNGSSSCVAQTVKKLALILLWLKENTQVKFSATHIYQRRQNRPAQGMQGIDAFDLWMKGITLEDLVPSERLQDPQMDGTKIEKYEEDIGKIFGISGHVGINTGDFEGVASVIQKTGKGVMVWFYFTAAEWSPFIPVAKEKIDVGAPAAVRHSVAAVDFFLYQGKKYLLIEDSAHFGGITRRLISEEFFKARNFFTRYSMNFKFQDPTTLPEKPHYTFTKTLNFSETFFTDQEVKALQEILKYEGLFPMNVDSTGYYGSVTAKAVLAFQKRYAVASDIELEALAGRTVGPKTIAKLNELYSL